MVRTLDVAAAAELLEAADKGWRPDELGPLANQPVLFIDLDTGDSHEAGRLAQLAPLPGVLVGLSAAPEVPAAPPACDVLLSTLDHPPQPWVGAGRNLARAAEALAARIRDCPAASCTLSQLLRAGEGLTLAGALVAESLAYSTLQSGPEFTRWLSGRVARATPERGPAVLVERTAGSLHVTLNRPQRRNAFNAAMRDALIEALDIAIADETVTEVHLAGAGPAFCSGGDLDEFGSRPDPATAHLIRTTRSTGARLARCSGRVTAHVHGACVGAGIELPAFARRVIAAPDTRVMLPEVAMGLVPGAGGTASIPRRIGRQRCAWLALSGEWLDGERALRWGLVDELAEPEAGRSV